MVPHVGCTCSVYRPVSIEKMETEAKYMRFFREFKTQGKCLAVILAVFGVVHFLVQ